MGAMRLERMEKSYVIAWKAKHREGAGRGKKLLNREEAEQLAAELNRDYPDFEHTVAAADAAASSVTQPMPPAHQDETEIVEEEVLEEAHSR